RTVEGKFFEKTQRRRSLIDRNAGKFTNADGDVGQGRDLSASEEIVAVSVTIFGDEYLRRLFRRDGLLNVVREDLAKRQVRCDVDVGRSGESVLEVVHTFDVKTRATLIGVLGVRTGTKDSILYRVKTGIKK